jgi:hypothetical protein
LPIFDNITRIVNTPKPNYVLQNNPTYKIIWDLYKKLLRKTKLIEILWPSRHFLIEQFVHISLLNNIRTLDPANWNNYFFQDPWIFLQPKKKKVLISNYLDRECVIANPYKQLFISILKDANDLRITIQHKNLVIQKYRVKLYFIFKHMDLDNNIITLGDSKRNGIKDINIIYNEVENLDLSLTSSTERGCILINSNDNIYIKVKTGLSAIVSQDLGGLYV